MQKEDKIKLCHLWQSQDSQGNIYLKGNLNEITKLLILKNKKSESNTPDFTLYITRKKATKSSKQ